MVGLVVAALICCLIATFFGIFVFTPPWLDEWWNSREPVRYRRAKREITAAVDRAIAELDER